MGEHVAPGGRRDGAQAGFTLVEVLVACLVLVVGLLGGLGLLAVAAHTTGTDRQRQAETSLAREVTEDARTLSYSQVAQGTLAGLLQPMVPGASLFDQGLVVTRSIYSLHVTLGVDTESSGMSGAGSNDYKRLSVTVSPTSGSEPTVQQAALLYGPGGEVPPVSCLSFSSSSCATTMPAITDTGVSSLTFHVTTTAPAAQVQWLVDGNPPASAQIGAGGGDPYTPSGTGSQFTWALPAADGTYTISAFAQDAQGNTGSRATVQVTLNRDLPPAPPTTAIYNRHIGGVDIQWPQSTDHDILYYDVYHQQAGSAPTEVCDKVSGTGCTDLTAAAPGTPPGPCTSPTDASGQPNDYWVIGYDTDPATGQPRPSTATPQTADANICDNPPSPPSGLVASAGPNGTVVLNWSAPGAPADIDSGDGIAGWRIYRWSTGTTDGVAQRRLVYIDAVSAGQNITTFTDHSPDPAGVSQNYCVTSVDTHLGESVQCSNAAIG